MNSVQFYTVSSFVSLLFNELPPEQQKTFSMLSEKIVKTYFRDVCSHSYNQKRPLLKRSRDGVK
jgi:hypothetical protein